MALRRPCRPRGSRTRARGVAGRVALAWLALSPLAAAQTQDASSSTPWDPAWTHANAWDYTFTGVGVTTLLTETALLQQRSEPPRWVGPILFDDAVRNVLRLSSGADQRKAETVSWALWFPLVGYPLVVDVPYAWMRFGRDVAWDLFWQSATALSLAGAADFALRDSVARVRPKNTDCVEQGGTNCFNGPEVTRSFPSGHVSETTTATALLCTQHLTFHLYGGPWDVVSCAAAATADVAVGVVKLMADDHWATDVLAGAALGVAFGWGVPTLLHLRGRTKTHEAARTTSLLLAPVPVVFERGGGLGLAGMM